MKSIILAAGYATRMYPLTENFPKPLLTVDGKTILDRLLEDIDLLDAIDEHIVVTNHKYIGRFEDWKSTRLYQKKITLIDDGSIDNEHRLGAVKDMLLAIDTLELSNNDLLVMAADNLLDFSLTGFIEAFNEKQTSMIMCYYEPDRSKLQRTGVITLDQNNRVINMEEKPDNPKSNWAVPPFYIYRKEDIQFIFKCILEGCNTDAPGNLAKVILRKTTLHAWKMSGKRQDIGSGKT